MTTKPLPFLLRFRILLPVEPPTKSKALRRTTETRTTRVLSETTDDD